MKTVKKALLSLIIFLIILLILFYPSKYLPSVLNGLNTWLLFVVPPLFPFFVLSKLLAELGAIKPLSAPLGRIGKFLFRSPPNGGYIIALSLFCGYPLGSKLIADNYETVFSSADCGKLFIVANTCSPLFVFGTVASFLHSGKLAAIVFFCHILGIILNGVLFRGFFQSSVIHRIPLNQPPPQSIGEIMRESILSILNVGGWIVLSFLLIEILFSLPPMSQITNPVLTGVLRGVVEMTSGIKHLGLSASPFAATILSCMLVSFGGFSVILQQFSFISKCKLPLGRLVFIKLMQASLSMLICFIMCLFLV